MTIQEWYDNFYTIRNNPRYNEYFGKQYIFISNVIDTKYADMENTRIISIKNETQKKPIYIRDFEIFEEQLKGFNNSDNIEITYDDIITKKDGTVINLKTNPDPVYIEIKDSVKDKIQKFIDNAMKKKLEAVTKSLGWSGMETTASTFAQSADEGEIEYPSQGGKRSRKRRRTTRRRKSRKY